jgi:FAD-binding domain/Ferric reductase like transmembrane component
MMMNENTHQNMTSNAVIEENSSSVDMTTMDDQPSSVVEMTTPSQPNHVIADQNQSPYWTLSRRGSLLRRTKLMQSGACRLSPTVLLDISDLVEMSRYDDAVHRCFDTIDADQSGRLERDELFVFLQEASTRLQLQVEEDVIHLAIDALIDSVVRPPPLSSAKVDSDVAPAENTKEDVGDTITREQFFRMFQNNPDLYAVFDTKESCSKRKSSRSLKLSNAEIQQEKKETDELWKHARVGWKNYGLFVVWLGLYIAATLSMFISTAFRWANDDEALAVFGNCIIIARSCAAALNLHACLILLPICRHTLTWLRLSWGRFLFPFDISLEVHMLLGWVFGIFAATHTLAHVCDYVRLVDADQADLEALLGHALPVIPESKSGRFKLMLKQPATITGIIMVVCMIIAYSLVFSRRKNFNRFWYFHHLLIVMLIMMCIHGTGNLLQPYETIYWVCGPLALYMIPRIYREINCRAVKVLGVNMHEDVVGLKLEKPPGWDNTQRAGMYAFINVPAISKFEWHPFTLSSSPFQAHLGIHVKAVGDWTKKLHDLMTEKGFASNNALDSHLDSFRNLSASEQMSTAVYIEGPIGASSQGFSDHESVVLIGAGIG